jgi:hypothetical protein
MSLLHIFELAVYRYNATFRLRYHKGSLAAQSSATEDGQLEVRSNE